MQINIPLGDTVVFVKDWNLVMILSPIGMLIASLVLIWLIRSALELHATAKRLDEHNTELLRLISDRNLEIRRLTNELEDARS